jgi:hypothetical protein
VYNVKLDQNEIVTFGSHVEADYHLGLWQMNIARNIEILHVRATPLLLSIEATVLLNLDKLNEYQYIFDPFADTTMRTYLVKNKNWF